MTESEPNDGDPDAEPTAAEALAGAARLVDQLFPSREAEVDPREAAARARALFPAALVAPSGLQLAQSELRTGARAVDPEAPDIVQELPPLQPLPVVALDRLQSYYAEQAERLAPAGVRAADLEPWGGEYSLGAPERDAVCDWAAAAHRATDRPVLEVGAGVGRLLRHLVLKNLPLTALDLAPEALRASARLLGELVLEQNALAEEEAAALGDSELTWWAGDAAAVPTVKATARTYSLPRFVLADASTPPFAPATFGCVIAANVLEHLSDWPRAVGAWADLLVPGGTMVIATIAEKDQDEPGFLSALGREIQPGIVTGYPRSQDLTWALGNVGLTTQSATVHRVRRTYDEIHKSEGEPAGTPFERWRGLLDHASESLRALYDIDEEGMTWRYMLLKVKKPKD
ncbi:MAG: class I SAM-dependent methyltransferase [Planctomycetota bacterium]|jgi:SAM-dependent methyltransferase